MCPETVQSASDHGGAEYKQLMAERQLRVGLFCMDSVDTRYPADESVEEELITRMVISDKNQNDKNKNPSSFVMLSCPVALS